MPDWIGATIGKVRVEKLLAQGGMAEVYLGTHLTLARPVAVKVLHSHVEEEQEMRLRFQREARVVAALRHPNIVQIFDFDTLDGHPYIVMEYLKGPSLAWYLKTLHERNERMQPQHIARLISKLATALDYAHGEGVVHRDIKPGNIMLITRAGGSRAMFTDQIEPVITDFGLVRIVHATTQTVSGLVSGTPAYISPEQAQGLQVDHRTDIYSLGVVLYELLAGRVPFDGETNWTVIYKHIQEAPPPIPNLHPAIQQVLNRALAKDPDDRYQTCQELARAYMQAIGTIAEAATLDFLPGPTQKDNSQSRPAAALHPQAETPRRRNLVPLLLAGAAVLVLAGFGLSRLFPGASGNEPPAPASLAMPGMGADEGNDLPVGGPRTVGLLRFQDGTAPGDQATLTSNGMALPPAGNQYEAWLIEEDAEQRVSMGLLQLDADGNGSLTYVDPQGRNLLGMYQGVEITVEPDPDNNPNPSNQVAYSDQLPPTGFMHVRHLLYSFDATPNKVGLVHGLSTDTKLLQQMAQTMLAAYEAQDESRVRSVAEGMINIIAGKQSPQYKDWDQDGTINDPSDSFGLLLNGENAGYIQGTFTHANLAMTSADATENMKVHGEHVKIAATNISKWAPTLRDQLILITQSPFNASVEGMVRNSVALANQIQDGFDANGNEIVEPIAGEGGAATAYEHAYYMADMRILSASNPTPAP
jgi:tRNA A-37 threonylcarbamoyl transferase component Bud32